jgi:hypothetical protein
MVGLPSFFLPLLFFLFQSDVPFKPNKEFEVNTKYELKAKPTSDDPQIVFETQENKRTSGSDMLPFLTLNLKVKKWAAGVTQIRISDVQGKTYLKKKPSTDASYPFEMGYVDDMKDKVGPSKFIVSFHKEKQVVEQITIEVEEDGTFLVNGERRGKF